MKNPKFERNRQLMKQYHRNNPWRLEGGIYVPHRYPQPHPQLSWWDDTGFILNKRRVSIAWTHPRYDYSSKIEDLAWQRAGQAPATDDEVVTKNYHRVGRSRKKVVDYSMELFSDASKAYYDKVTAIKNQLETDGIEFSVVPHILIETFDWCTYVSLCSPLEVRDTPDLVAIVQLTKRLLKRESTLAQEFHNYQYGLNEWLSEAPQREQDQAAYRTCLKKDHTQPTTTLDELPSAKITHEYSLDKLVAQIDPNAPMPDDLIAWEQMRPVGREII